MQAQTKAGGDARAVDGGAQQEAADVLAEFVEELRLGGARRLEAIELGDFALGADLGVLQVAGRDRAAGIGDLAIEHQAELVAGVDVATEVELVAEQLDHLGGQFGRRAGGDGGGVERIRHLALGHGGLAADLLFHFAQAQRAVEGARQGDGRGGACAHGQADQPDGAAAVAGPGDGRLEDQAGLDVHCVEGARQGVDGLLGLGGRDAQPHDGLLEGFPWGDPHRHLFGAGEAGLGLGLGEGFVLQGVDGGGVKQVRPASLVGIPDGQLPAQDQGRHAGHANQGARRIADRRVARIELLHRPPELRRHNSRNDRP